MTLNKPCASLSRSTRRSQLSRNRACFLSTLSRMELLRPGACWFDEAASVTNYLDPRVCVPIHIRQRNTIKVYSVFAFRAARVFSFR